MGVRATVRDGRLINEATDFPDGTVLDLVIDDEGDQLDSGERDALNAAISQSLKQGDEGNSAAAETILQKLRSRSGD